MCKPSESLIRILKTYGDEINDNQFEKVILDAYLQGGEACLAELKKLFEDAKIDLKPYNRAIERIIKALLKNSDLLD